MQEGTFEWYKAIFNSLLKSDMKNFQNQKDCYDLLLNMKIDLKFDDKQIKNYALKISQYTHKMAMDNSMNCIGIYFCSKPRIFLIPIVCMLRKTENLKNAFISQEEKP